MTTSRRAFVGLIAAAPLAFAASRALAEAPAAACYDPASLPLSQRSRRRSVDYLDVSADPARHCGACSFFTAASGMCGTCAILGGGPVNAGAVCSSFAARGK